MVKSKSQAPNYKQIPNHNNQHAAQAPALRVTKTFQEETMFGISNFDYWKLPALLNKSQIKCEALFNRVKYL